MSRFSTRQLLTVGLSFAVAAGLIYARKPITIMLERGAPPRQNRSIDPAPSDATLAGRFQRAPAQSVTVARATERDFVETLFVSGTLTAREEAMVGAGLDGLRIVELLAEDGDRVQKGQTLARLDRSQLDALIAQNDAALLRAEAAIGQARSQIDQVDATRRQAAADLDRAKKLEVGVITQATLDQRIAAARTAEAQLAAATSALAVAQADRASREAERRELMVRLDRTELKAPVAGIVSRRTARLGAVAMGAGDALFRIIADGAVDLEAEVPENWIARLATGMPAKVECPGGLESVEGHVRLIASEVDRGTRLGKVRIALPADTPVRIGSFATGSIEISHHVGIAVPASAVTRTPSGDSVDIVRDGRIERRDVTVGVTNGGATEIGTGLAGGELVVARAAAFLREGDEVRLVEAAHGAQW